jgi:hypothetical protein
MPQIATFHLPFQQFACTCDIRIHHIFDAMHVPQRAVSIPMPNEMDVTDQTERGPFQCVSLLARAWRRT